MTMFYRGLWMYTPSALLKLTKYSPGTVFARLRSLNAKFSAIGKPLYDSNAVDGISPREGKRDVMSVLSQSRASSSFIVPL